jgi:hypothetical protein
MKGADLLVVSAYQGASPAGLGVETLPHDKSGHLDLAELAIPARGYLLEDLVGGSVRRVRIRI